MAARRAAGILVAAASAAALLPLVMPGSAAAQSPDSPETPATADAPAADAPGSPAPPTSPAAPPRARRRAAPRPPPPPPPAWFQGVSTDSGLPRPLPRETPAPRALPMERRIDVGAGLAFLAKLADEDAGDEPTSITYQPTFGLEVHLRIPILEDVEVSPYFLVASHGVDVPDGGLDGVVGSVDAGSATALTFGARIARTYRIDPLRVWANAGVGYGRMEFGRMTARDGSGPAFEVRERGASFVEFPFGFGGSIAVVPRWLSVDLEGAAGPVLSKSGPAFARAQTIDGAGLVRDVGALPEVNATLVAALGVSLIL